MGQTDERARRSLEKIKNAFIKLVTEQGFDAVTVNGLAIHAGVNRATFYRHYKDKYDLSERLFDHLFAEVQRDAAAIRDQADPMAQGKILFEHIGQYADFYRAMLGRKGIPGFRARVQHEVAEQMTEQLAALRPSELVGRLPEPVAIQYMAAAQVGLAQWWLENDMPFPPEQAAAYLMSLHMNGGLWGLGLQPD